MPNCQNCSQNFNIVDGDRAFYEKIRVPEPKFCGDCRQQRRLSFRNERILYKRKCDLSGKTIISVYKENSPFPVYDNEEWHSDKWESTSYGMDFDFNRPFFDQFAELYKKVPRIALMNQMSENSDYCNYAFKNKNSYLLFGSHYNEDSLYGNYIFKALKCVDTIEVLNSELIYEGIYCDGSYHCAFVQYCFNSSNCFFCYDLIGCKNCLFSSNLRNKEYQIFNKQYSKEDYEKFLQNLNLQNPDSLKTHLGSYEEVKKNAIKRASFQKNTENCFGNDIENSKNIYNGFAVKYFEDGRNLFMATHAKDCMDCNCLGYDGSELLYECVGNSANISCSFMNACWRNSYSSYCEQVFDSRSLFGCVGMKRKEFCILNKQYGEEEFKNLLPSVLEHMKKTGELGEFFPSRISEFAYNETIANDYFPLTKESALAKGFKWLDADKKDYAPAGNGILACELCMKNYKIVPQEQKFYEQMNLPIPTKCPECRHLARLKIQGRRKLWERNCSKCSAQILAAFPPESTDKIYCDACYMAEIY